MNRGDKQQGYTIVETLIFLAVSALMFVAAMVLISGRQNSAMFVDSVRDFETKLTDVANDLSTGYPTSGVDVQCAGTADGPDFSADRSGQCVFVGTVVKFGDGASTESLLQYSMLGLRTEENAGVDDALSLGEAKPRALNNDSVQALRLLNGTSVRCVMINNGPCNSGNNAALGFFTSFSAVDGRQQAGGIKADLVSFRNVNTTDDRNLTAEKISQGTLLDYGDTNAPIDKDSSVVICLTSGTTNQYALVRVGSNNSSRLTFSSEIRGGNSCTV